MVSFDSEFEGRFFDRRISVVGSSAHNIALKIASVRESKSGEATPVNLHFFAINVIDIRGSLYILDDSW